MTPNNIVRMASLCGIDMIALTDHNSCKNCRAAVEAGNNIGLCVIPGMELCSQEEIHIVCLFPSVEAAEEFGAFVESRTPEIKNNPRIFGEQIIMDSEDNEIGREENLLITASRIAVNDAAALVKQYGGAAYPAHIDKDSYSILSVLGEFPPESGFCAAEITCRADAAMLKSRHPALKDMLLLTDSDAHWLDVIAGRKAWIELREKKIQSVIDAINGKCRVKCGI